MRLPEDILAYSKPIDMRKSFSGLLGVVRGELRTDPLNSKLYVFINKRGNYLKCIYWDRTGFCLFAKKLTRGTFKFPLKDLEQTLTKEIFYLILDGN